MNEQVRNLLILAERMANDLKFAVAELNVQTVTARKIENDVSLTPRKREAARAFGLALDAARKSLTPVCETRMRFLVAMTQAASDAGVSEQERKLLLK